MARFLRIASWVLLTLAGLLLLSSALGSAQVALSLQEDQFGAVSLSQLTGGDESLTRVIHARRLTAAAFAAGFAVFFLLVTLIPYRRGEVWSWFALLAATAVTSGIMLLRLPYLDVSLGASVGYTLLAVVVIALLLDVGRLRSKPSGEGRRQG